MGDNFDERILGAHEVRIASGYLGRAAIERHAPRFEQIVIEGGLVQIICGMGAFQGIGERKRQILADLHETLRGHSNDAGVFFCTRRRYHGKMFLTQSGQQNICSIGSSNFSSQGLYDNLEANWISSDPGLFEDAVMYFNLLLAESASINRVNFAGRQNRPVAPVVARTIRVPPNVMNLPVAFSLSIKTTPRSNINLSEGPGRVNQQGIFTPRPYYEVEVNIPVRDMHPPLTNFIPNVMSPHTINVCGSDGVLMEAKFKRKTQNRNDDRPLHNCGGDFMTSPREPLGRFLKGRLIASGLLGFGDPVTEEILEEYGANQLEFRQLEENVFHINF